MSVNVGSPRALHYIGDIDKKTGRIVISREAWAWINDIWRRTGGDTDGVAAAAAGGDLKTFGVGVAFIWHSDPAGVFPAGNPTRDLVVVFYTDGAQVATRTVRGTLNSSLGTITGSNVTSTGETTTFAVVNDGTDSVRIDVTHTESGAIASASFTAVDISTAGGSPASGGSK